MSPSFDFSLGEPLENRAGRWVHGRVVRKGRGYAFNAKLMKRYSPTTLQCHSVRLDVDRPFRANDFAAFAHLVSTGTFETVPGGLSIRETKGLDFAGLKDILKAAEVWIDPWEQQHLPLLQDLTSIGAQLEQVRKRELLGLALARFSGS